MLEMIEKYGQGLTLYLGWFLGDNRTQPKIQPLNLLDDERLLICSLMCLVGSLAFYYLSLLGQAYKPDVIYAALGQRLSAWAWVVFIANVIALLFGIKGRVLDVTSAVLRVVPIVALMQAVFSFAALQIADLIYPDKGFAKLIMLLAMAAFTLVATLIALPRSLALVEGMRSGRIWTIVLTLLLFILALDIRSIKSDFGATS